MLAVTNNPMLRERIKGRYEVCFVEGGGKAVLIRVRDMVYMGHRLYTHPLAGNLSPKQTPYRTVMLSEKAAAPCGEHCVMAGESAAKWADMPQQWEDEQVLHELQLLDCSLAAQYMETEYEKGGNVH